MAKKFEVTINKSGVKKHGVEFVRGQKFEVDESEIEFFKDFAEIKEKNKKTDKEG
ncbi:MAG: hypothetical protein KDC45_09395 [Bacteroidetes bacterium]|nr:hypothetical protein [Bacteroidota bacterium]